MKLSDRVGYLYIIESERQNAVKLGFAVNPDTRIAPLRTGNPDPLKFRIMRLATLEAEQYIQSQFKRFSIAREWYADDGLLDMLFDDLCDEAFDRVTEKLLNGEGSYEELYDNEVIVLKDAKAVVPAIIKEHGGWIAAGRPTENYEGVA